MERVFVLCVAVEVYIMSSNTFLLFTKLFFTTLNSYFKFLLVSLLFLYFSFSDVIYIIYICKTQT